MTRCTDPRCICNQPVASPKPATSDGSLDEARLARALRTLGIVPDKTALDDHISDEEWELVTTRTNAQAIAAEYASLSESPSEGKTE